VLLGRPKVARFSALNNPRGTEGGPVTNLVSLVMLNQHGQPWPCQRVPPDVAKVAAVHLILLWRIGVTAADRRPAIEILVTPEHGIERGPRCKVGSLAGKQVLRSGVVESQARLKWWAGVEGKDPAERPAPRSFPAMPVTPAPVLPYGRS
jgi:hypothetical protein